MTVAGTAAAQFRIGCSGWNYKSWKGRFYPADLPASRWLQHYLSVFDTVEVNNTFYRLPEAETFASWRAQTPASFVMAVKASRFLTHMKRLRDPEEPLERLFSRARELGPRLGPVCTTPRQLPRRPAASRRISARAARAVGAAIAPPAAARHRVPASVVVRGRDVSIARGARRRAVPARQGRVGNFGTGGRPVHLRPFPRHQWALSRQLWHGGADGVGVAADRAVAVGPRCLRLLQQRPRGDRPPQRPHPAVARGSPATAGHTIRSTMHGDRRTRCLQRF